VARRRIELSGGERPTESLSYVVFFHEQSIVTIDRHVGEFLRFFFFFTSLHASSGWVKHRLGIHMKLLSKGRTFNRYTDQSNSIRSINSNNRYESGIDSNIIIMIP